MCRPCCPLIPSPCIVLFVVVEDGCSLLFGASVRSKWIIIQELPAPSSLLGDFNPMSMIGSILDHLDVCVATHLRVVLRISSAPDRGLCSPARLSVHVEWPVLPDLRRRTIKVDSHITFRAHAVPMPCRAAKGLECVFPI